MIMTSPCSTHMCTAGEVMGLYPVKVVYETFCLHAIASYRAVNITTFALSSA